METAHISRKLGRGRHTTRVSRLYPLFGGYVADTPGFSSFDTDRYILIPQDKIQYCFREFDGYIGKCRFSDCSHCKEQGCAVSGAASEGAIPRSRYDSYGGGDPCLIPHKDALYIAADRGLVLLRGNGIEPDHVIGDFDSTSYPQDISPERIVKLPVEKDDTDTMYAVKKALCLWRCDIELYGCTGGRLLTTPS